MYSYISIILTLHLFCAVSTSKPQASKSVPLSEVGASPARHTHRNSGKVVIQHVVRKDNMQCRAQNALAVM